MSKRRQRLAVWTIAGFSRGALTFCAIAAYGYYVSDWGFPSPAETERPRAPEDVVSAFADEGIDLDPADVTFRTPAGARVYEYEAEAATLFVMVCRNRCNVPDVATVDFLASQGPPRRMRHGIGFVNVAIWVVDADRRSGKQLVTQVHPVVDDLDSTVPPDDRCYVG